ncbi:MAG: HAD hydrolase-like protein [Candidatus Omnitrophica bacterium]|nr:HAD hydrolase-like protein [Candidatus Omnitrophota bacterium]
MTIDVQTARHAKVKAIIVTTGSSTEEEIRKEKPFMVIQRLKEIKKIL